MGIYVCLHRVEDINQSQEGKLGPTLDRAINLTFL